MTFHVNLGFLYIGCAKVKIKDEIQEKCLQKVGENFVRVCQKWNVCSKKLQIVTTKWAELKVTGAKRKGKANICVWQQVYGIAESHKLTANVVLVESTFLELHSRYLTIFLTQVFGFRNQTVLA